MVREARRDDGSSKCRAVRTCGAEERGQMSAFVREKGKGAKGQKGGWMNTDQG